MTDAALRLDTIDLTNCDREPIHLLGLIQPHGVLLVLREPDLEIIQLSRNTEALLGRAPESLLGRPLAELLSQPQVQQIQSCLTADFESINPLSLTIASADPAEMIQFDGIVHRWDGVVLLELEPKTAAEKPDFFDFYHQVKGTITQIQKAGTLLDMCQVVVREIRRITGFDRVMVYRFAPDGAGRVIAEDTDQATPYLDLHYPPTDVPKQARQLYMLNWLRLIPDAQYQPVDLLPAHNPITGQPLDLSFAVLRSVSPIHIEYMHNMGVSASMSISLLQDQQLWGLISCHHSSPKHIPYSVRTMCEFIGQVMSAELTNKETSADTEYKQQLKTLQAQFVETLSKAEDILSGMAQLDSRLLELVSATGAVICSGAQTTCIGRTPAAAEIPALLDWIKPQLDQGIFATSSLSSSYPPAAAYQATASGVLALEISRSQHYYLLWFRPEVIQTVVWGGNPNKPAELVEGQIRLSPRKSFEQWQETVRGTALAWKPCEIQAVTELRNLIVGIVLRQAEELASINFELQRSNEELDSFAYVASHDLKEPLRGIHNYANFLMEDYAETLDEDGVAKLQTLVRLTQRMEDLINSLLHFSRLGRIDLLRQSVDLNEVVQQVIATLSIARPQSAIEFRIPQPLPRIECDRSQTSELFTNLISNAIKYNDKAEKWVEIGCVNCPNLVSNLISDLVELPSEAEIPADAAVAPPATSSETPSETPAAAPSNAVPVFYVRDNGIGIAPEHFDKIFQIFRRLHGRDEYGGGTGAGLTIARKIAERHGGRIWVESVPTQGTTFYFTLAAEVPA